MSAELYVHCHSLNNSFDLASTEHYLERNSDFTLEYPHAPTIFFSYFYKKGGGGRKTCVKYLQHAASLFAIFFLPAYAKLSPTSFVNEAIIKRYKKTRMLESD